ncbi:uncharacterized protein K441DRAFT_586515, partial [Cenococcum geophilum 1.58]|uniref:uncharacterized protein n=1 Tax=Cenococcum geophilum 1.58 TaxID=794803 RepID=UPI00358E07C8
FLTAGAFKLRSNIKGLTEGNKRLALLSDAVLRLYILNKYGDKLVRDIGINEKLYRIAKDWNLRIYLKENPLQKGEELKTALALIVEAILGAIWVDFERNFGVVHYAVKKF